MHRLIYQRPKKLKEPCMAYIEQLFTLFIVYIGRSQKFIELCLFCL